MLEVFVPSRSRFDRSRTLERLEGQWDNYALVVPAAQAKDYAPLAAKHGAKVLACPHNGISKTRQWIGQRAKDKFIMLDDDLKFFARPRTPAEGEPYELRQMEPGDMRAMLTFVEQILDKFKHASITDRVGAFNYVCDVRGGKSVFNPKNRPYALNRRPIRALAFRRKQFLACEHGRVDIMEDFDITLQLLQQGYPVATITEWAQDQLATQLPGGCSDYRTEELHAKNVKRMAELHPKYVMLREKENKSKMAVAAGLAKRLEATIRWSRVYHDTMKELIG
jgi:hypothetical protein